MTRNEAYELWQYEKVRDLSKTMTLVQNINTKRLMIRRVSAPENLNVLRAVSELHHPNLMRVYDAVIMGGVCVSLCEYIEGITLEASVSFNRPYDELRAKRILIQVCDGLTELHRHGIIHRDITPTNVMIQKNGNVKIIDFDITRIEKPGAKKDTAFYGTAGFAAPEQFGFAQTDERSDVYSCGVLLNYLLTGELPGDNLYGGALNKVIRQCIEIDSNNRYESADQLAQVLKGVRFSKEKRFRPLPGFRSKKKFPKVITVIGMILYVFNAITYLDYLSQYMSGRMCSADFRKYTFLALPYLLFWTVIPYILHGDVFMLSRRICPSRPSVGRGITVALGIISFVVGWIMTFLTI